jgi:hypothetical protein
MLSRTQPENRRSDSRCSLIIAVAALGAMLAPLSAGSRDQQETPQTPRPATPVPTQRTPVPTPTPNTNAPRVPVPAPITNTNTQRTPVPATTTNANAQRTPVPTPTTNANAQRTPVPANGANNAQGLSNFLSGLTHGANNATVAPQPATNNTQRTPVPATTTNINTQRTPVPSLPVPANGAKNSQGLSSFLSGLTHGTNNATVAPQPATNNLVPKPATTNNAAPIKTSSVVNSTNPTRVASLISNQPSGHAIQSRTFVGHPGPAGSIETQNRNGDIVRKAADGTVIDVHSPKNGMLIHHGLDGSRRIVVDRPDRSRIVATSRGVPYVQHPYTFGGHSFDHRTFYVQGHLFHQLYRPYTYAGTNLDVYATPRFYEPKFYQWATSGFNAPQTFAWGYTTNPPPWFAYYKGYFTPEATYTNPLVWLTDFLLASSLERSYSTARPASETASADGSPAITPQVKQLLADEVGRQVKQESHEAQENAQHRDPQPGAGSVVQELGDGQPHVFVAASDLDLVDPTGRRCMISEGDVVQVVSGPQPSTSTASAVVLASKGGLECGRAAQVEIALTDLQEMQNHMRETIDQGMANTTAGKAAASVTPAYAASAPPPDADAAHEIDQQQQIAAAADG